ncbi:hypothetical protein Q5752_005961 [Cryptotrichosporon argae]
MATAAYDSGLRAMREPSEAASPSASPTLNSTERPSAKISCLACRAAKRKCQTPDANTTCKRCASHVLVCEYKKHNRGRKRKNADEVDAAHTLALDLAHAEPSPAPGGGAGARDEPAGPLDANTIARYTDTGSAFQSHSRATSFAHADTAGTADIQFSHVVPDHGDSSPFLPGTGRSLAPADAEVTSLSTGFDTLLRADCPDPITAGVLRESDAYGFFEYYFGHLNVTLAVLDPVLHTASSVRERSPLLFTAVLTVTSKIIRPKAYPICLALANRLVGQAVEFGLCSVEIVQAIILLTHFKKADDATSWRRVGYAIRMAQEIRLNVKGQRPLPKNERQAREILNGERAWLNLIGADYHLAIHHTLPRMLAEDDGADPVEWITDHAHLAVPGESTLAPWIMFSRMCRLYADMLAGMNGDPSNLRMLAWIELEWKRWRGKWLERFHEHNFLCQQIATIKLCDALYRFHICEYRLLYTARYRNAGRLDVTEATPLSMAFADTIDASLAVASVFQDEFVRRGTLPYCFNLVWVALGLTCVWLVKNIKPMSGCDRARVVRSLTDVSASAGTASCSSDDMAAYMHRLAKHLLAGIPPEWQLASFVPPAPQTGQPPWGVSSSQQIIHEQLWGHPPGPAPAVSANANAHANVGAAAVPLDHAESAGGQVVAPSSTNSAFTPSVADPFGSMHTLPPDDLLFPAADDDIWCVCVRLGFSRADDRKILFPDTVPCVPMMP